MVEFDSKMTNPSQPLYTPGAAVPVVYHREDPAGTAEIEGGAVWRFAIFSGLGALVLVAHHGAGQSLRVTRTVGVLLGCAGVALLAIVAAVALLGWFFSRSVQEARVRRLLREKVASVPFAPPADGRVPEERLRELRWYRQPLLACLDLAEVRQNLAHDWGEVPRPSPS